jgi:hypothetical protein
MILQCDGCGESVSKCAKIPCGFLLEVDNRSTRLIMPTDKSKFRNFCIRCLFEQSEELKE